MSTIAGIIPNKVYTMPEAADALQVDPRTLTKLVKNGKIKAGQVGLSYRITGQSLLAFAGTPAYTGDPFFDPKAPHQNTSGVPELK